MYFTAPEVANARLAAVAHCVEASSLWVESGFRSAELLSRARRYTAAALGDIHDRHFDGLLAPQTVPAVWRAITVEQAPAWMIDQMRLWVDFQQRAVRLFESQLESANDLLDFSLRKLLWQVPPELEHGLGGGIGTLKIGNVLIEELAVAAADNCDRVERAVERRIRRRRNGADG